MRRAPLLVLTLVILASPLATAGHREALVVADGPRVLTPLAAPQERNVTARVPCDLIHDREDLQPVDLTLQDTPPWLRTTLSPHTVLLDPERCPDNPPRDSMLPASATLLLQVTTDAPAFTPTDVRVTARLRHGSWNATGNTTVESGFFNLVNAHAPQDAEAQGPGDEVRVPITVTNLGNDRVTITLRVADAGDVDVTTPDATVAPSLQQGDATRNTTVTLTLRTPTGTGFVDRHDVVHVEVVSRHYQRLDLEPLKRPLKLLVSTQGLGVPAPGFLTSGAAFIAVALALGTRRGRP